jgi:hypothetical protein
LQQFNKHDRSGQCQYSACLFTFIGWISLRPVEVVTAMEALLNPLQSGDQNIGAVALQQYSKAFVL